MDDIYCPVCLDAFKEPKLLLCRHTFCKDCLEQLIKRYEPMTKRQIVCPCCRTENPLQIKGIAGYPNNYFVRDQKVTGNKQHLDAGLDPDEGYTGVLREDDIEEDGQGTEENCFSDEQQWTRPRVLRFPRNHSKTHYHCQFLSSVNIERSRRITCLCPMPLGNCLVVADCSNIINVISLSGVVVSQYRVLPKVSIYDIVCRNEGTLLLLASDVNEIISYQIRSNTHSTFITLVDFRGNAMASMSDGCLAVTGVNTSGSSSIRADYGQLLVFSSVGTLLKRIGDEYMTFKPSCVAINSFENRICFTDVDRKLVSLLNVDGSRVGDFTGRSNENMVLRSVLGVELPRSNLKPSGLCCDAEGNIIVVDEETQSIFVLDYNGLFRGFVVLEDREGEALYRPFLVACDPTGTLWVGDNFQGKVNVYKTSNFINVLDQPAS
ncbi:uncharacterized protein LOC117321561 isoform X1 [Pecten maximus]|uniref:uncharacterized protein LOC117321561 isoform X1 n=1 Tax=Pecten maximus TaxID=6579 RepID=UPI0014583B78|nr:uncharacterized protein LOC117321561 isoform X1 [Pecten maximus]